VSVSATLGAAWDGRGVGRELAGSLSREPCHRLIESLFHCDTASVVYEVGDWHDALGPQSSLEPQASSSSPGVMGTATRNSSQSPTPRQTRCI
jgi:hypothetical protein